jgi:hypothetical protein
MYSKNNLFISKLPLQAKKANVREFMERFGEIRDVFMYKVKPGDVYRNARVRFFSRQSASDALAREGKLTMYGQFIKLEYFIHDKKIKKNLDLEKCSRRVCVKHIPSYFSHSSFKKIVEKEIGEVEDAYVKQKPDPNAITHGFITFKSRRVKDNVLRFKNRLKVGRQTWVICDFHAKKHLSNQKPVHSIGNKKYQKNKFKGKKKLKDAQYVQYESSSPKRVKNQQDDRIQFINQRNYQESRISHLQAQAPSRGYYGAGSPYKFRHQLELKSNINFDSDHPEHQRFRRKEQFGDSARGRNLHPRHYYDRERHPQAHNEVRQYSEGSANFDFWGTMLKAINKDMIRNVRINHLDRSNLRFNREADFGFFDAFKIKGYRHEQRETNKWKGN